MKWLELSLQTPKEYVEPLSTIFHRYGDGRLAVELAGGYNPDEGESEPDTELATVRTYLKVDQTTTFRKKQIQVAIELIRKLCQLSDLQERYMSGDEWLESWKSHFSVLRIGNIVICPTWESYLARPSDLLIKLDPGMAFGTGHHPTTQMCLEQLGRLVSPGMKVLDVGTGSGILAMAAAKLGAAAVLGLDIDPAAVKIAKSNIRYNGLQHLVKVRGSHGTDFDISGNCYDLVVANLYSNVILDIGNNLMTQVASGGHLIISGILSKRSLEIQQYFENLGCIMEAVHGDGDWAAFVIASNKSVDNA